MLPRSGLGRQEIFGGKRRGLRRGWSNGLESRSKLMGERRRMDQRGERETDRETLEESRAFAEAQDLHLISAVLDGAKQNMGAIGCGEDYFVGKTLTADSNYHSPMNIKKCEEKGLEAYIHDKRFIRRDSRFHGEHRQRPPRSDRLTLADFRYQEERDEYRCPKGIVFRLEGEEAVYDGVIYRRYSNGRDSCKGCELKVRCIKGKKAKPSTLMAPVGSVVGNLTKFMVAKIDSQWGRRINHRRMAIAEPVFANIRTYKAMNRFTLRGKIKVNIQWLLYCIVHNMGKLLTRGPKYAFTQKRSAGEIGLLPKNLVKKQPNPSY
jgi:hypothetical protein